VGRAISGIILKIRCLLGIFVDCGLISPKGKGPTAKSARIFRCDFFSMRKYGGPGPPSMDHGWRRSTVDHGQGLGGGSPELGQAAAMGHGGSQAVAQRKEGCTGSPSRASPGHGRRRGDRATMVKMWR
jgi:hypothetical protein